MHDECEWDEKKSKPHNIWFTLTCVLLIGKIERNFAVLSSGDIIFIVPSCQMPTGTHNITYMYSI